MGSDTWRVLVALATLGAVDLTTARTVEPHWDAVAIDPDSVVPEDWLVRQLAWAEQGLDLVVGTVQPVGVPDLGALEVPTRCAREGR